jgi:hypothetical protein
MNRRMKETIAGALLLAAAASPFAANAADSASVDRQFAWFMRNLETTDGAYPPAPSFATPSAAFSTPSTARTDADRTVWPTTRMQAQAPQEESYQFEQFEDALAQGSSPNYTPSEHAGGGR